jgi:hypothetical protein
MRRTQRRRAAEGVRLSAPLRLCVFSLLGLLGFGVDAGAKETYLVIIAGIGGDEAHRKQFHETSMAMRDAATTEGGVAPERVFYLGEDPAMAPEAMRDKSTKENVAALFRELEGTVRPGDQLFVLLVGHGSYDSEEARFNLPGRDLTASDFDALLAPFGEQQVVFVNTASASGAFLPALSKPNRIVVTATKSGYERNEAQFGKYFVEAYSGVADTDKNERVSVLEAFEYARQKVDAFYREEKLLKTEHAQLDDVGDGAATGEPGGDDSRGHRAGSAYLSEGSAGAGRLSPADLSSDPELAALVARQRDLEGRVEALRLQKESLPEDVYLQELERLLLDLAAVTQKIEERTKR